ncbi:MAG TPA: hypothetical protein VEW28_00085 [Candidatus Kapabacteria bacterium]|nr:hypothetical protein [Candidatus Kapabacteria bacterium]
MPSKETYLIYFFVISGLLLLLQWFIYHRLAKIIRRDFPERARRVLRIIRLFFFLMNIPLLFLFFRRQIHAELPMLTNILFLPFTVWQGLIIIWTAILIPVVVYEFIQKRFRNFAGPDS